MTEKVSWGERIKKGYERAKPYGEKAKKVAKWFVKRNPNSRYKRLVEKDGKHGHYRITEIKRGLPIERKEKVRVIYVERKPKRKRIRRVQQTGNIYLDYRPYGYPNGFLDMELNPDYFKEF